MSSYSPSALLQEILQSKGLDQIADEDMLNGLSVEEKERIYDQQKEVITIFRQRSAKEISSLQERYNMLSPMSSPASPASTSSENLLKPSVSTKKSNPSSPKPQPLSRHRNDFMSRSVPFFDPSSLNRKNSRQIDTTPQAPKSPPVAHFTSLDKRPRFNNYS